MTAPVDLGAWLPLISIVTTAVGATAGYYGSKSAFMVQLAVLETKLDALTSRVESDHAKLDELSEKVYSMGAENAN